MKNLQTMMGTTAGARRGHGVGARFRVLVAEHHGMCFGVRDAIAEVEKLTESGPVTILGQLVHNAVVRGQLAERGAVEAALDATGVATDRVVITAHGASDRDKAKWQSSGHQVTDTTCPLVHRAHEALADLVANGCFPVVIGKKDHVETRGLAGDYPAAHVIESPADLADLPVAARYGIVAQTTQPVARVQALVDAVRRMRPESVVEYRDTVCRPTKDRQAALEDLCRTATLVVVVGGSNSNNTRELVESVRARGLAAHRVERPSDLEAAWFAGHRVVGVTAGTSTLHATVDAVVAALRRIAARGARGSW
jgi:4-hydroxy-3-methylbut-2-enyl diphosphate reductase